jgi:hypothetical protein
MKLRIASLSLLALCLAVVPAIAQQQEIYSNGPINGTTDAWTINSGFVVSDSFFVGSSAILENGLQFGAWLFPGDVLQSAEVSISSAEFGGTTYTDQIVNFTETGCSGNQYGFSVCTETGSFGTALNLAYGTYWLNLQNAVVNTGDPIYWDENSGPSSAAQNSVGTIPSESFAILGVNCSSTNCNPPPSVPEPSVMLLFGSGILGLAGILRRKLF